MLISPDHNGDDSDHNNANNINNNANNVIIMMIIPIINGQKRKDDVFFLSQNIVGDPK